MRNRHALLAIAGAIVAAWGTGVQSQRAAPDPFEFFKPTVEFTARDRERLDTGQPVVRVLPDHDGEIAIVAAIQTSATGGRLATWTRHIEELKRSPYVSAIAKFSDPPQLTDLQSLVLDPQELDAITKCRPGACELKLTAPEILSLKPVAAAAGSGPPKLLDAFRHVLLDRVQQYLTSGHAAMPPYADRSAEPSPERAFSLVAQHSPFLELHAPELARYLTRYPDKPNGHIESFVYWSYEQPTGRPSVNATHVALLPCEDENGPEAIVAGKQIFATHYVNASLSITAIVRAQNPTRRYLVYVNRTRVDILDRWYAGMARAVMGRRISGEAADILQGLRTRLENGEPTSR